MPDAQLCCPDISVLPSDSSSAKLSNENLYSALIGLNVQEMPSGKKRRSEAIPVDSSVTSKYWEYLTRDRAALLRDPRAEEHVQHDSLASLRQRLYQILTGYEDASEL